VFLNPLAQALSNDPARVWDVPAPKRPLDIHDVVTWDWPARPPEAPDTAIFWAEADPHKMDHDLYTWRLLAAGWITADGEVTW